jgi:hypothetical protein
MELTKLGRSKLAEVKKTGKMPGIAPLDYAILIAVDETDNLDEIVHLCKTCRTYRGIKIRASEKEILARLDTLKKSGLVV